MTDLHTIEDLVTSALDGEVRNDPLARHPRICVHRVTKNVILAGHLDPADHTDVIVQVCMSSLRYGYVVEFETPH